MVAADAVRRGDDRGTANRMPVACGSIVAAFCSLLGRHKLAFAIVAVCAFAALVAYPISQPPRE